MKKKVRFFLLALSLVFVLAGLTACGGDINNNFDDGGQVPIFVDNQGFLDIFDDRHHFKLKVDQFGNIIGFEDDGRHNLRPEDIRHIFHDSPRSGHGTGSRVRGAFISSSLTADVPIVINSDRGNYYAEDRFGQFHRLNLPKWKITRTGSTPFSLDPVTGQFIFGNFKQSTLTAEKVGTGMRHLGAFNCNQLVGLREFVSPSNVAGCRFRSAVTSFVSPVATITTDLAGNFIFSNDGLPLERGRTFLVLKDGREVEFEFEDSTPDDNVWRLVGSGLSVSTSGGGDLDCK